MQFQRDLRVWLRHALCILALAWTGIVNGQAFFFYSDSTNYVRTADVAIYLLSGKRISTAWTERYRDDLAPRGEQRTATEPEASAKLSKVKGVNDLSSGVVMAGRSPYLGALLYVGYVTSNFWAFVLLQAAIAYALIILTLKRLGLDSGRTILLTVLGLSALTSLPTYNSLLLADAFTGFGILAFVLLAAPGRLSRVELLFLAAVLVISVTAHLTHIWIVAAMTLTLLAARLLNMIEVTPRAWIAGVGSVLIGLVSVQATTLATKSALGAEPQLLPLLSARFISDGPGWNYIRSGCDNQRFEFCKIHIAHPDNNILILFSTDPADGGYLQASPEQKKRMGEQDVQFALAVLNHDPAGQIGAMLRNTLRQLIWIDYDGLNVGCWENPQCWHTLPEEIREELKATPSGQNAWPQDWMNGVLYATVASSLALIAVLLLQPQKRSAPANNFIYIWLISGLTAFFVSAFLGGAVVEPQYRYTGRIIWLVPFLAAVLLALKLRTQAEQARGVVGVSQQPA